MVDRDPVTNPAGDMVAAQKMVEVLSWIDEGGEERFYLLADVLLGWKGKRLRDAIANTGVVHLGKRQTDITPQTPADFLGRLARAAGLVLSGPNLEAFIHSWLQMEPGNATFRVARLEALGGLVHILVRRKERDLTNVSLMLIDSRNELPAHAIPPYGQTTARRIDTDGYLAEHLYRTHARRAPQIAGKMRQWFCTHGDYLNTSKHRVAREAVGLGHWDIIKAFFASGQPYGQQTQRRLPAGAQQGDLRTRLSDLIIERMATGAPQDLEELAFLVVRHVTQQSGDVHAMLEWLISLGHHARKHGDLSARLFGQLALLRPAINALCEANNDDVRDGAATLLELGAQLWPTR